KELFLPGTAPTSAADIAVPVDIDEASGLLWQEGCVGPMVTENFIDLRNSEAGYPVWQKADQGWQARAAKGPGKSGGPKRTRTAYFYGGGFYPFGRSWGGSFAPTKTCPPAPPSPSICVSLDPLLPCPSIEPGLPPDVVNPGNGKPKPTKQP
ncbi:MAG: hypothetical protein MUQ32_07610, partial [Chloroflexi bacterium]|nr:hypothetical protein [Chloroflexota bacterium]